MTDLRDIVARIPNEPGVYRFLDGDGEVLYVGKAKALRKRVASYFRRGRAAPTGRIAEMVSRARDIEYVVTHSETEALLVEDTFIKEYRPPFNLRLRDDKSYPYIEVTMTEEWPRVRFMRGRHTQGNLYFGPFSSARKVRETLELIGRIFPYRKCKGDKPGRASGSPCLQYFIHRSLAPCDGRADREEYLEVIAEVVDFLRGRLTEVGRSIEREMAAAARDQQFEKAALLRDRLAAVRHVQERQSARAHGTGSFDVIALYQEEPGANLQVFRSRDGALVDRQTFYVENVAGREPVTVLEEFLLELYWESPAIPPEIIVPLDGLADVARVLAERRGAGVAVRRAQRGQKRRLLELAQRNAELSAQAELDRVGRRRDSRIEALERLRDALGLASLPLRIECYDISNLGERHPVGSMVVFEGGLPKKAHYRKFAVHDVAGQDDFAMMNEVVGRRFERHLAARDAPAGAASDADLPRYDESFAARPDLLVIDGGKGQLSAALAALAAAGLELPVIGLAKQYEEVYVPGRPAAIDLRGRRPGLAAAAAHPRRGAPVCRKLPPSAARGRRAAVGDLRRAAAGRSGAPAAHPRALRQPGALRGRDARRARARAGAAAQGGARDLRASAQGGVKVGPQADRWGRPRHDEEKIRRRGRRRARGARRSITRPGATGGCSAPVTCRSTWSCRTSARRRPASAPAGGGSPSRWRVLLERYFAGEPVAFALDAAAFAAAHGCTRFETLVYTALAGVRYGEVVSYRDLAVRAGHPNAYRAVGSAMARNPLPIILPCHRVIKNDGHCGPYGDDPAWKRRLLALEGRRVTPDGRVQP